MTRFHLYTPSFDRSPSTGHIPRLAVLCATLVAGLVPPALANPLAPDNLRGFDGIVTHCVSSTDKTFAITMCDRLVDSAKKQTEAIAMSHVHLGTVDWTPGGGTEPDLPSGPEMKKPLHLAFYLRGTDGSPAGAIATAQFFVPYNEGPGEAPGEGRLLIWQDATLGSGPPKATALSVADGVSKKMKSVFDALGTANPP
jgi:hypothetical protein